MKSPQWVTAIEGIQFYHDPLRESDDVAVCFQSPPLLEPGLTFSPYIPFTKPEDLSEDFVPVPELKSGRHEFKNIKFVLVGSTDLALCQKVFDSLKLRYD